MKKKTTAAAAAAITNFLHLSWRFDSIRGCFFYAVAVDMIVVVVFPIIVISMYGCTVRAFLYLICILLYKFDCIVFHLYKRVPFAISSSRVHHHNYGTALCLCRHIYEHIYMAMRGKICCKLFTVIAINKTNLCFQPLLNQQQQQ